MKRKPNMFQKYLRRVAAVLCIICVVLGTPVHAFAESGGSSSDELIDEDSAESISESTDTTENSEELISEDSPDEDTSTTDFSTENSSEGVTVSSTDELIEDSDENSTQTDSSSDGETLFDEKAEESNSENTSVTMLNRALRIRRAMTAQNTAAPSFTITYEAGANSRFSNGTAENKVTYTLTHHDTSITKYSHTANIDDTGTANGTYASNLSTTDTVTIPGAAKLTIDVWYSTESTSYDWLAIYPAGVTPSDSNYSSASISGGKLGDGKATSKSGATHKQFTVNGDTAQFYFKSDGGVNFYGYYATITADGYDSYDATSGAYEEPVPNDSQKSFLGWYTDTSYSSKIENPISLKTNSTVYARIARYTDTGTWGTCPWGITKDGVLEIGAGTGAEQGHIMAESPWKSYASQIKSIKTNGKVIAPTECLGLFQNLTNVTTIDLSNFDTSKVGTNINDLISHGTMSDMFSGCSRLTSLDISGWNTSNVTEMSLMFYDCSSLTSLDVSNWKTDNVTNMSWMFCNCSALAPLDVSGWNTSNVTNMNSMFSDCSHFTTLDISGWNTSNVTDMSSMFYDCSALTALDVSNWNTDKLTSMHGMFCNCSALASLDVSKWNTSNVTKMGDMFDGCSALTTLDVSGWNTSNVTDMSGMFSGCSKLTTLDVNGWDTGKVTDMGSMFYGCSKLTSIDISGWDTSKVTNMGQMFDGCSALTSLDVSGWNTGNVTRMYHMFNDCYALTTLDVSNWNTSKVTSMSGMFYECKSLASLDLSKFDMSKASYGTDAMLQGTRLDKIILGAKCILSGGFFDSNAGLSAKNTGVYTGKWTYPNAENHENAITSSALMDQYKTAGSGIERTWYAEKYSDYTACAVYNDGTLTFLRTKTAISSDTTAVTSIDGTEYSGTIYPDIETATRTSASAVPWYSNRANIKTVTFKDPVEPKDMDFWFYGCSNLATINGIEKLDTSKTTDMWGVFCNCSALSSIDVSKWDTSNAIQMAWMFSGCSAISTLDVSNWNTSKVKTMYAMFQNCSALSALDVSKWNTSSLTNVAWMFGGNVHKLSALDLSNWDMSKITESSDNSKDGIRNMLIGAYLMTLKLGSKCKLQDSYYNAALVTYNSNDRYTGKWTKKRNDNHSDAIPASDVMAKYKTIGSGEVTTWAPEWQGHTVSFDPNGGTGSTPSVVATYGYTMPAIKNGMSRTGYTFAGYFDSAEGGTQYYQANSTRVSGLGFYKTADTTLYAHWTANQYTVHFDANGGTGTMTDEQMDYDTEKTLSPNTFVKSGYSFSNWNTSANGSGTSYKNEDSVKNLSAVNGDTVTLYAQWGVAKQYIISFNANGGTGSMQPQTISNTGTIQGNSFLNAHHTFAGWNTKADGTGTAYADKAQITPTADMTLYAQWKLFTYTIVFNGNGNTSGTMANETMPYGTAKALSNNVFVKTGHVFAGWNTKADGSGTAYEDGASVENLSEDNGSTITLYAQWGESTELPNTGGHGTHELTVGAAVGMGICLATVIITRKHKSI